MVCNSYLLSEVAILEFLENTHLCGIADEDDADATAHNANTKIILIFY